MSTCTCFDRRERLILRIATGGNLPGCERFALEAPPPQRPYSRPTVVPMTDAGVLCDHPVMVTTCPTIFAWSMALTSAHAIALLLAATSASAKT